MSDDVLLVALVAPFVVVAVNDDWTAEYTKDQLLRMADVYEKIATTYQAHPATADYCISQAERCTKAARSAER